jgi:hypothetical protein
MKLTRTTCFVLVTTYSWEICGLSCQTTTGEWRMPSSGMLRLVTLVRTNVSRERSASIIRVTRICELGTTLAVTSNQLMLRRNTSVLTRAIRRNIPKDGILRDTLKSYNYMWRFVIERGGVVKCDKEYTIFIRADVENIVKPHLSY